MKKKKANVEKKAPGAHKQTHKGDLWLINPTVPLMQVAFLYYKKKRNLAYSSEVDYVLPSLLRTSSCVIRRIDRSENSKKKKIVVYMDTGWKRTYGKQKAEGKEKEKEKSDTFLIVTVAEVRVQRVDGVR